MRSKRIVLGLGLSITVLIGMCLLATGVGVAYAGSDWILPGVYIAHFPVGGVSRATAEKWIDQEFNYNRRLRISDGNEIWEALPVDFGLWVDPADLAKQAEQIGKGKDSVSQIVYLVVNDHKVIQPQVMFSSGVAQAQLQRWSAVMVSQSKEARLVYKNGKWDIQPGESGRVVDVPATLALLAASPDEYYWGKTLSLVTQSVEPAGGAKPARLVQALRQLSAPVKFSVYDPITDQTVDGSIPSENLADILVVTEVNGDYRLSFDPQKLAAFFTGWQPALGTGRVLDTMPDPQKAVERWRAGQAIDLLARHLPTEYQVQEGDTLVGISMKLGMPYWKILEANPGLNADQVPVGKKLVIPSKNDLLPLPAVRGKRIVISISQQRMWTYENGQKKKEYVISTGIASSPTMPGIFQVQTHQVNAYASVWDLYMPNFLGIYESWPGFMNGIHGLPTLSSGRRLWENVLGWPASYGCIILNLSAGKEVYDWAENGVVVEIRS